jgi:hypothetical protein
MTDQEILDNAPEGATHFDTCTSTYWHNSSGGYYLICSDGSTTCNAVIGKSRSLADIRRIVELEKDRNVEYIPLDDRQLVYLTVDDLNRIKIEQQAKGLEDFAQSLMFRGCFENSFNKYDADEAAIELRSQAKALKEQVKL